MKQGKDRRERQDHPRRGRHGRRSRAALRAAALAAVCGLTALAAAPAQATTGGASAATETATGGLAFTALRTAGATWYGPGFYGNQTACGQTLRPQTIGVAHRDLPCGTAVKFVYRGRAVVTRVIDRGPYASGIDWDLTNGARRILGFEGSGAIRYALELRFARSSRFAD